MRPELFTIMVGPRLRGGSRNAVKPGIHGAGTR